MRPSVAEHEGEQFGVGAVGFLRGRTGAAPEAGDIARGDLVDRLFPGEQASYEQAFVGFDRDGDVASAVGVAGAQPVENGEQLADAVGCRRDAGAGLDSAVAVDDGDVAEVLGPVDAGVEPRRTGHVVGLPTVDVSGTAGQHMAGRRSRTVPTPGSAM